MPSCTALSSSCNTDAASLFQTEWCLSGLFLVTHSFSHFCCHISVIDHVCLLRCPCSPARVWNCKSLLWSSAPCFLFSLLLLSLLSSSDRSSTRGPVFLVQVRLNHVLQASAAFWFILFALHLDCTGQRWPAIILNIAASVSYMRFPECSRWAEENFAPFGVKSSPSSPPRVTFVRAQKSRKDS